MHSSKRSYSTISAYFFLAWESHSLNPGSVHAMLYPLSFTDHFNYFRLLLFNHNNYYIKKHVLTVPLTPSGFTTLVTVTDWKKDLILGWPGGWAGGGVRIWSRPPDDTAESRSGQDKKSVPTQRKSLQWFYYPLFNWKISTTSVFSTTLLLWTPL